MKDKVATTDVTTNIVHDSHYRPDIDGLRAIAVLSVVAYHGFPRLLSGGFIGVDIFFVISGFLISGIIFTGFKQQRFSYAEFYRRRIRRIFPSLITVLVVSLTWGWFFLGPDQYNELGRQTTASAGFVSNILMWHEAGYFDEAAELKPLLHLWSLGVEEQFYLFWPLVVTLLYKRARYLSWALSGVLLASFAANIAIVGEHPSDAFYLPITRFWELLIGSQLAYMQVFKRTVTGAEALATSGPGNGYALSDDVKSAIGFLLLLAALVLLRPNSVFPGWWAVLPTFGAVLIIAAPKAWLNRTLLSNRWLVFVGLISYPLYLWHWVMLTGLRIANDGAASGRAERIAAIAMSFLLAWLTYKFIETPLRFGKHRASQSVVLFSITVVLAALGIAISFTDGAAFRYPQAIRPYAAFQFDAQRKAHEIAYRENTCVLGAEQTFADVPPECVDTHDAASPLIVLWGDSYASSLFPALRTRQLAKGGFRIAQFTESSCPPVQGLHVDRRPLCESFNDAVVARIAELKPAVVLMEADWVMYQGVNGFDQFEPAALQATIARLKAAGVGRVVVFGPLPVWMIPQPRVIFEIWNDTGVVTHRTQSYLDPLSIKMDTVVPQALVGTEAVYFSPMATLCNDAGCLLSTDPKHPVPISWDTGHLTEAGATLLIDTAAEKIFGL